MDAAFLGTDQMKVDGVIGRRRGGEGWLSGGVRQIVVSLLSLIVSVSTVIIVAVIMVVVVAREREKRKQSLVISTARRVKCGSGRGGGGKVTSVLESIDVRQTRG